MFPPMPSVLRALLVSAVATGAAAAVLHLLKPESAAPPRPPRRPAPAAGIVDADALPEAERDLLLRELDAHV